MASYPHLFRPIRIGGSVAKNRIVRLAMTTNLAERNEVSDKLVAHHRAAAKGGVGTIVTETVSVHPTSPGRAATLMLFRPEVIPGLRRLADAVHEENCLLFAQLNHRGRQHHASEVPTLTAPSALACPRSGGVPHEMTTAEIEDVIAGFVSSAVHAARGGLDGVEVHAAHGHLVHQFLSPLSNRRTDAFGGDAERRMAFLLEILRRIRAQTPDLALCVRMSVDDFTPGGVGVAESRLLARRLVDERLVDVLSLSQSTFDSIERHLPDRRSPPTPFIALQAQVKAVIGDVPAIVCTRIGTPEEAEDIVAGGRAELIGMARALIADPDWPAKAAGGRRQDIRDCIWCNQCWGWITQGQPIACAVNPAVGRETEPVGDDRAKLGKRIVVAGGGPAGLEAARAAAERGHSVLVLERRDVVGGKLADGCVLPGHEALGATTRSQMRALARLDVRVRTGTPATAETILAEKPDVVIVATGATAVLPELPSDGSVPLLAASDHTRALEREGRVIVMDEDAAFWSSAIVESFIAAGRDVTLVTRFFEPLRELPATSRIVSLRLFDEHGVVLRTSSAVDHVEGGAVVLKHFYSRRESRIEDAAAVVWVGPQRANDELAARCRARGVETLVVGDAFAPRRLTHAILEGYRAGRTV